MEMIITPLNNYLVPFLQACWHMMEEMAPYMCLGFVMAGVLHIFVNPRIIFTYLGEGRVRSVLYATLLGIPLPLCSCGVLPTAAGLKRQGANDGATMAFMIATPETGADSIAVTYALLDPIMTIFRPLAAFVTAITAGLGQNFLGRKSTSRVNATTLDLSCKVDNCCDGINCPPEIHRHHHSLFQKIKACFAYGFGEILDDIAKWLIVGIAIAGAISVLVPDEFLKTYLGGGIPSMLIMLVLGIPFYICATASTPIAAALILKGVSPGAALVFLLAGPATNAATISVVYGLFRKRATFIYLGSIAVSAVLMGTLLDGVYNHFQIAAASVVGEAGELIPHELGFLFAAILVILIGKSLTTRWLKKRRGEAVCCAHDHEGAHDRDHQHRHVHDGCHDHGVSHAAGHGADACCDHSHGPMLPLANDDAVSACGCSASEPGSDGINLARSAQVHDHLSSEGNNPHDHGHHHGNGPDHEDAHQAVLPVVAAERMARLELENRRLLDLATQMDRQIAILKELLPDKH